MNFGEIFLAAIKEDQFWPWIIVGIPIFIAVYFLKTSYVAKK